MEITALDAEPALLAAPMVWLEVSAAFIMWVAPIYNVVALIQRQLCQSRLEAATVCKGPLAAHPLQHFGALNLSSLRGVGAW